MTELSGLFRLNLQDLAKGLVMAVIGALIAYFSNPQIDFTMIDWNYILHVAVTTGVAYLAKNLVSTSDGKVLGKIG